MGAFASNGQQYATLTDLYGTLSVAALTHPVTTVAVQNAQLLKASELVDSYLRDQFQLPLGTWGPDIVQCVCDLAAYRLVCLRGFNPEKDGLYKDNYEYQLDWLRLVASGKVSPDILDASPGGAVGQASPNSAPAAYSPVPIDTITGNNTRGRR